MFKNIQFKIILIIFLVGIIIIGGLGVFFLHMQDTLNVDGQVLESMRQNTYIVLGVSGILYIICSLLLSAYLSNL